MHVSPPEDWNGKVRKVLQIASVLRLKESQSRRIQNVISKTHHSMLAGEEYDSMRYCRVGSKAIQIGSIEHHMVADMCERVVSYTECTILINIDCLQRGRPTITRSAVRTCERNMVRIVSNVEKRPQGNKDASRKLVKAQYCWVT